jgi:hypothetical protein
MEPLKTRQGLGFGRPGGGVVPVLAQAGFGFGQHIEVVPGVQVGAERMSGGWGESDEGDEGDGGQVEHGHPSNKSEDRINRIEGRMNRIGGKNFFHR